MFLTSIYLYNFRLYDEAFYEFSPHINMICGANARGKTSLLEAIHFLITGKSFRALHSSDLIRRGAPAFFLEARFTKHGVQQTLRISCSPKERKILYNSTPCPSSSSLLGLMHGVVFCPDDISLVKGPPHVRRQFLDMQIAQADPLYIHHLMRFNRAMQQRNYLLKAKRLASIESWESEMAASAAYLTKQRQEALEQLQAQGNALHKLLTDDCRDLRLVYKPGFKGNAESGGLRQMFVDMYRQNRHRELDVSYTLYGPHKDDVNITIAENDVRFFASEGQQRSCVAALRLAEWLRLKEKAELPPLMLIDDAGVSLDDSRRSKLFKQLGALSQVFLTSTADLPLDGSGKEKKVIRL